MASKRHRMNLAAVASSYNYPRSKTLHIDWLKEQHNQNKEVIIQISAEIKVKTHAYTIWCGKRIELTMEEAKRIETSVKIYYE